MSCPLLECLTGTLCCQETLHKMITLPTTRGILNIVSGGTLFPSDDFESYADGVQLNTLNLGFKWNAAWVDRFNPVGIYEQDTFDSYVDGVAVNGLSGGELGWSAAWVDRAGLLGIKDQEDFEGYADGASVNGLSGGNLGWSAAWVDR